MPIIDGIVRRTQDKGVDLQDICKAMGLHNLDVGALCSSDKVNKWAKYKPTPFTYRGETGRSITTGQGADYWKKPVRNSLNTCAVTSEFSYVESAGVRPSHPFFDSLISKGSLTAWTRIEPTGGSETPYRVLDFDGYKHATPDGYPAKITVQPSFKVEEDIQTPVYFDFPNSGNEYLSLADFSLTSNRIYDKDGNAHDLPAIKLDGETAASTPSSLRDFLIALYCVKSDEKYVLWTKIRANELSVSVNLQEPLEDAQGQITGWGDSFGSYYLYPFLYYPIVDGGVIWDGAIPRSPLCISLDDLRAETNVSRINYTFRPYMLNSVNWPDTEYFDGTAHIYIEGLNSTTSNASISNLWIKICRANNPKEDGQAYIEATHNGDISVPPAEALQQLHDFVFSMSHSAAQASAANPQWTYTAYNKDWTDSSWPTVEACWYYEYGFSYSYISKTGQTVSGQASLLGNSLEAMIYCEAEVWRRFKEETLPINNLINISYD